MALNSHEATVYVASPSPCPESDDIQSTLTIDKICYQYKIYAMMNDFFAQQREWDERASKAQAAAAQAYLRLLRLAELRDGGQAHTIARFVASMYNSHDHPFDPLDLRAVDVPISDDMLLCLDALRWGRADLYTLIPDGDRRIQQMCKDWRLPVAQSDA